MGPNKLKYLSRACLVLGFLIPFLASNFVGMSLTAMPMVSVATIVLWIIGLLLGYYAYLGIKKPPSTPSFLMRIGNYISSEPQLFLTLGIVYGYLYYPSVEKSVIPPVGPYLLMFIMFSMGLAISVQDWKRIVQRPEGGRDRRPAEMALYALSCLSPFFCIYLALSRSYGERVSGRHDRVGNDTHGRRIKRSHHDQ